ncbi:MAG: hypothetical protein M3495_11260 [Pseudomonadota bacterium]|nr:hypothetical protein [Pseudomonadota bacterium]
MTKEPQMREQLKVGHISLSGWQEGVGSATVGIDLANMDSNADPVELAKRITSQGAAAEKWMPKVKAEQAALKAELQELGLW